MTGTLAIPPFVSFPIPLVHRCLSVSRLAPSRRAIWDATDEAIIIPLFRCKFEPNQHLAILLKFNVHIPPSFAG